jgi:hypothetical protein
MLKPVSGLPTIDPPDSYLLQLKEKDAFEFVRLADLKLQRGKRERFMGYALQWMVEPGSKIAIPLIEDGYSDPQREKINRLLRARLWEEVSNYYECVGAGNLRSGGNYDQTVTPRLINGRVVSFSIFTEYYCGGAHPDSGDSPITLDTRTGKELTLEDVVWVGKGKPVHYEAAERRVGGRDFDAFATYRTRYLAPWLVRQVLAVDKTAFGEHECHLEDSRYWQFPGWYLTRKGIGVTPSVPHVMAACTNSWVIPYAVLRSHPGVIQGIPSP